jgi:hypothetical protein
MSHATLVAISLSNIPSCSRVAALGTLWLMDYQRKDGLKHGYAEP